MTAGADQGLALGRRRLRLVAALFAIALVTLALRLADLALWRGERGVGGSALAGAITDLRRADIVDRNGALLATDYPKTSIYADPALVLDAEAAASRLAAVLYGVERAELLDRLTRPGRFVWLKRHVTEAEERAVIRLGLPGVAFRSELHRIYPQRALTAHLVGYVGVENQGLAGIEGGFERRLTGESSKTPLMLTIDLGVQEAVRSELASARARFAAQGATGIVLDVATGELLAAVSLPDFDPNNYQLARPEALFNRNTLGTYELGSLFKLFTVAMALDAGAADIEGQLDATQPLQLGRHSIGDFHAKRRWLSVPEVIAFSSNIGAARMAQALGTEGQHAYFERFGLLDRHPIHLPEVGQPQQPVPWRPINTVTAAYGHGLAVSPLQVADAVAATVCAAPRPRAHLVAEEVPELWSQMPVSAATAAQAALADVAHRDRGHGLARQGPGLSGRRQDRQRRQARRGRRLSPARGDRIVRRRLPDRPAALRRAGDARRAPGRRRDLRPGAGRLDRRAHGRADHQPHRAAARPAAGRRRRRDLVPRAAGRGAGDQRPHRAARARVRGHAGGELGGRQRGRSGMRLSELLDPGLRVLGAAGREVEISGLSANSRTVEPGMLFAALAGSRADGRRFVADAIAKGAVALLVAAPLEGVDLPQVVDPDPRRRLALLAARFYGKQPRCIAAVTGTSGKTSVAGFVRQLWTHLGHPAASLGTLGLIAPGNRSSTGLTTPDPVRLHALLAELAAGGVDHLALEASSHGLDQRRLDGVRILAAAFTNLSRDHFDYHGSFDHYLAAKRRLFGELLAPEGTAVLNADQPEVAMLTALCRERGIAVLDYGERAERLRLLARRPEAGGQRLELDARRPRHMRQHAARGRLPGGEPAGGARLGRGLGRGCRTARSACSAVSRAPPAGSRRSAAIRAARRSSSTMPTSPMRWPRSSTRCGRTRRAASSWCSAAAATATQASGR